MKELVLKLHIVYSFPQELSIDIESFFSIQNHKGSQGRMSRNLIYF